MSAVASARADALAQLIDERYEGRLRLTRAVLWHLGELGHDRPSVAAAVDQLVQDGRATVEVEGGVVIVKLTP